MKDDRNQSIWLVPAAVRSNPRRQDRFTNQQVSMSRIPSNASKYRRHSREFSSVDPLGGRVPCESLASPSRRGARRRRAPGRPGTRRRATTDYGVSTLVRARDGRAARLGAAAPAALVVLELHAELEVVVERAALVVVEGVVEDAEYPLGRRRVWRVHEDAPEDP